MLLLLWSDGVDVSPRFGAVEFFAGEGKLSQAFRDAGHRVASYDLEYGEEFDFFSPSGFAFLGWWYVAVLIGDN